MTVSLLSRLPAISACPGPDGVQACAGERKIVSPQDAATPSFKEA
jgi:hypothetical protein